MYAFLQKQNNASTTGLRPANQPKQLPSVLQSTREDQGAHETVHGRIGFGPQSGWSYPSYDFSRVPVLHTPVRGVQAKLTVNVPGDAYEKAADRVADQVMRMASPQVASTPELSGRAAWVAPKCNCGGTCDDCKKDHSKMWIGAPSPSTAGGAEAPTIVQEVLRSPSQPLDSTTRAFMEPRFGHDFSHVRVHTDEKAAESARAVGAKAYTVGNSLVFGPEEYSPGSPDGRRLLAHELTHVVQEQGTARPVLRRAVPTWAGEFDTDLYGLLKSTRQGDLDTYGLGIRLKFTPFETVNADKIALVQSAISLIDGSPKVTYTDPNNITATRMTDVNLGDPVTGLHIDAWPRERTPVVGMTTAKEQTDLSESVLPAAPTSKDDICTAGTTSFGSRTKGKKPQDAKMCDIPSLAVKDKQEASQHFETTALAVEGKQKGIYYGSVNWGWEKARGAKVATIIKLKSASKNIPTGDFARAADLWNKSVSDELTEEKKPKPTIPLPIGETKFTSKERAELVDEPSYRKPKTLARLPLNTQVEVIEGIVTTNPDWNKIVVVDGKLAGMSGWIRTSALADRQTDVEKAEPKRKK